MWEKQIFEKDKVKVNAVLREMNMTAEIRDGSSDRGGS